VLVADTYNHKLKELDPEKGTIRTIAGDGRPGTERGGALALFEPGGLHAAGDAVYLADTNNHRVVRVALPSGAWSEITIEGLEAPAVPPAGAEAGARGGALADAGAATVASTSLRAGAATSWRLAITLPEGAHASDEAPASVRVSRGGEVLLQRTLLGSTWPLAFELPAQPQGPAELRVQASFAYCHEGQGVCVPAYPAWNVPVRFEEAGADAATLTAALA
jgi:hypothetical protein